MECEFWVGSAPFADCWRRLVFLALLLGDLFSVDGA